MFFSPTLGSGGAERQVLRLLKHLDRRVVRPSLSVARAGGSYEPWLPQDIGLHVCTTRARSSLLSSAQSILPLRRRIQEERPDVVASLITSANIALASALASLPRPPKLVLGVQNNFSMAMADRPWHLRMPMGPLCQHAYGRADHIVALSQGVANDFQRQLPVSTHKTSVVYNAGTDTDLENMAREPLPIARPSRPLIVACGRLIAQKDLPTLLRALSRMQAKAELWVLGTGPLKAELIAFAEHLGLSQRVRWLGFVVNPFPYMAAADVFALSSRWEGFANVLVEALACGTPVVATDCPYGPAEILEGGRHGRLVPVRAPSALASALDAALVEGKNETLSARCRERARAFDAASSARGYAQVFSAIAASSVAQS
jgi:glycosyltransferase involved in cell wall biosynthesis